MEDQVLTPHFRLSEFSRSHTADSLGIDNSVPPAVIPKLSSLCEHVLEPLREHFGIPVVISSGYRCPALNKAVGGVPNSQHQKGEAADIVMPNLTEAFCWLLDNTSFDQLGFEQSGSSKWIHVSCRMDRSRNRQQVFRARK